MPITISLTPSGADYSARDLGSAGATLTLSESYATLGVLLEDEVELRTLVREARHSADRTIKKLDETIAYVGRALGTTRCGR